MRADEKTEKKLIINQWGIAAIYIAMIVIAIYSISLISRSFTDKVQDKNVIATYKQSPAVSYVVNLKENDYFDTETLSMNQYYITRIIDSINANFNYTYDSDHPSNLKYTYNIQAVLTGKTSTNEGDIEVWSKKYTLLNNQTKTINNTNSFTINENVKIDYQLYQDIVNAFKAEVGINIDANLNVKLNVDVTGDYESKQINETATAELNIPVGTPTMKITTGVSNIGPKAVYDTDADNKELVVNYATLFFGTLLATLTLMGIAFATKQLIKLTRKTEFTIETNRILKTYGDIIAESRQLPDFTELEVIDIVSFQDMVDIEEELRIPIIYTKVAENIAWFTIIHDNRMYRYIVD